MIHLNEQSDVGQRREGSCSTLPVPSSLAAVHTISGDASSSQATGEILSEEFAAK